MLNDIMTVFQKEWKEAFHNRGIRGYLFNWILMALLNRSLHAHYCRCRLAQITNAAAYVVLAAIAIGFWTGSRHFCR